MEKIKRIVLIVMLSMCTLAYSIGDPLEPLCPDCQAPENPIDGSLSLLLIAGTAYGIYELRKRKKKKLFF